ncbi:MAG: alpha/beta fold hydrolase [Planctomycetia bacterium]|nr:alpha/beta fold hydrolase [Planctomycetia bacterium]
MAVDLAFDDRGSGTPLVIIHGLFGSKRNWASIATKLALRHRVLVVDVRNHGVSPWDDAHDYPALADDVGHLIRTRVGGPAAVIGHSMGGKAAMTLALSEPELVERLVAVDIPPAGSVGGMLEVLAALEAVPLEKLGDRAEVAAALAAAVPDAGLRAFLAQNVVRGPGGLRWAFNLAALRRHAAAILGFPAIPPGRFFPGPTLFVIGGRSNYVRAEHRDAIERLFPAATLETVLEAGHWVHADAPGPFLEAVGRFLGPR